MLAYEELLNRAQYRVVSAPDGPMLVVAGAGTGKTRTIVYRLAWLVEHGVDPYNIILLTFTRKAAKEMLERAQQLLGEDLVGLYGGTFHAFAYRVLRQYKPAWLGERPLRVMDGTDQSDLLKRCREEAGVGKRERGFPKTQTIVGLVSKARNKETSLEEVITRESSFMLPYLGDIQKIADLYEKSKKDVGLLDYDDLLFEFENLLLTDAGARASMQDRFTRILVDEYQDTNLVQARLIRLLAGSPGEGRGIMAVGDEAQSIYAFRGATVRNILDFPKMFPGTRVVPLEENYRSVQPVLRVANTIMSNATEGYEKVLKAVREGGEPAKVVRCATDVEQARCVARRVLSFLEDTPASEVAVLFRSGYQSYQLEAELTSLGVRYRKFGGLRYQEAAHVKDLMAYLHLVVNPLDYTSFVRVAMMHEKVGPKTADKIYHALQEGRAGSMKGYDRLFGELRALQQFSDPSMPVSEVVAGVMGIYEPHLQVLYPEDHPTRWLGLQELQSLSSTATDLELFLAELLLDSVDREEEDAEEYVTLSTIHSAKGLEWRKVMVLDLVNGRLPSRFADVRRDVMEEERRLMYVACTRARDVLELYWYPRSEGRGYAGDGFFSRSTFLDELGPNDYRAYTGASNGRLTSKNVRAGQSGPTRGRLVDPDLRPASRPDPDGWPGEMDRAARNVPQSFASPRLEADVRRDVSDGAGENCVNALSVLQDIRAGKYRRCRHGIFGEGRIMGVIDGDKLQIRFPVLGLKTIMASYVYVIADQQGEKR